MAQNNAINNRTSELTIDPGASGDAFNQFAIAGTDEWRIGVDDDDGDSFKLSQGAALGTNDTFVITPDGERTLPLNPCFYAFLATDETNVTGDGTIFTVGTNTAFTEVFDQGSNLTLNPVTFTAPVVGRYLICFNLSVTDATVAVDRFDSAIVTSNRNHTIINAYNPASDTFGMNQSVVLDMDASDTATFTVRVAGEAADTVDVFGDATGGGTSVSGCLVS